MTSGTEKEPQNPTELQEGDLEGAQGGLASTNGGHPIAGKKAPGQEGIIVVDEDGLSGPNDQFPGKK